MRLYFIHCGFYDQELSNGIFEFHVNIPIVAPNVEEAKKRVRENPAFLTKKMHIDGIEEIRSVDGYSICLELGSGQATQIESILHRDL